jgi:5-methylcytosine-specific restriction endonuclease McrA
MKGGELVQTLVLDIGYQPVARVSWETSIVWVLDRIVEVVDEYPDRRIRTTRWSVPMPSIVRFLKPLPRKKAIKFSRHNVYARDGGRCQYCGQRVRRDEFTYDHVRPRVLGGATNWENVVVACVPCNQRKAGRTPTQAGMTLRSTPAKPRRLPDVPRSIQFTPGMPETWKGWLRSAVYWDGELEHD